MPDSLRAIKRLKQHLQTDALLGIQTVPIALTLESPAESPAAPGIPGINDSNPSTTSSSQFKNKSQASWRQPSKPSSSATPTTSPTPPLASQLTNTSTENWSNMLKITNPTQKQKSLDQLNKDEVSVCTKCVLCETRIQTVFGEGSANAKLMFIGEGPGQTEDETGRPFIGRAGKLLTKMIEALGMSRDEVFIANVVKCRPPNNRTPLVPEVQACSDYLRKQIAIIKPKAIVTLGGPAAKLLLQTKVGITAIRGKWHDLSAFFPEHADVPVMPTFHPAYLLRVYTVENRQKVWSDLQLAMTKVSPGNEPKKKP